MRILNIVNDLSQSNKYLSIEYFMDRCCVSKRTLQNGFSYMTKISKSKGFNLIQKRGSGYLLEIVNKDIFNRFVIDLEQMYNQPKLNVENIIAYVALTENYVTIDEIDNYLCKYNLKMKRKAHYGLRVEKIDVDSRYKASVDEEFYSYTVICGSGKIESYIYNLKNFPN